MTRREYFISLFPTANEKAFKYLHQNCCRDLGICYEEKDCGDLSCRECWNKEYVKGLPLKVRQNILDKFTKLW